MRVIPKENYQLACYPSDTALDNTREYEATAAYNQPDYERLGLVFVQGILLDKTEYTVIDD